MADPIIIHDDRLNSFLQPLKERLNNTSTLMKQIAAVMADAVEQNFATEGSRLPGGWPQLKKKTLKWKSKHGYSKVLQNTGQLAASVHSGSTENSAYVGTNKIYAAIQQLGGTIQRYPYSSWLNLRTNKKGNLLRQKGHNNLAVFAKKSHKLKTERKYSVAAFMVTIPPRPFLALNQEDINLIQSQISNFLIK